METEKPKFEWHRPNGVPMSVYLDFTEESVSRIGENRTNLLSAVDVALNGGDPVPGILELPEEEVQKRAKAWCKASGDGEEGLQAYRSHLSLIYELVWRRVHGPALFERRSGATPCPDYLPCTSQQVHASMMGLYRFFTKLWNWGLVVTVPLVFPVIVLPLGLSSIISTTDAMKGGYWVLVGIWLAALASFIGGFFAARALRGRK